ISGAVIAEYTLNHSYPPEISSAHRSGQMHIHDLSVGTFAGYCAGWSLSQLLMEGFNGVRGRISAKPAKHFNAALGQIVNFLGTLQNEWAGAQAFSSFDTYLAPLAAKDNLSYRQVKQSIQEFVFAINATSRWGNQVPFTNLTFDLTPPEDLKGNGVIYGGKILKGDKYGDYQEQMDMINKAFLEVMLEGDMDGRVFTFPIPTYNLTADFDWDSEISDLLFRMTAKYGIPYFQNFINSDLSPNDVRSMCCRLQLDVRQLAKKTGALFGSGEKTGSIGVVTINLPRIGYESSTEEEFLDKLDELMYLARESLEIKRRDVDKNMEQGLLPWSKRYLGSLDRHFSTIGLVGMNEACLNFMGKDISSREGVDFSSRVLDFMRERLEIYQKETSHIYNLEATPAEGTAYRLARLDKKKYSDIVTAGEKEPYYTNSSHLPVSYTDDVFFALEHQQQLQPKYTGGTVMHTFLGESPVSEQACKNLVKKMAYSSSLPYFTISPTYSVCEDHGYISGEHPQCPECGTGTEVYSRVVGYYRPVKNWNDGKQEEFKDRKPYAFPKIKTEAVPADEKPKKEKEEVKVEEKKLEGEKAPEKETSAAGIKDDQLALF
ncbi:MAG: ribonucleoside triphosphate reductase, partial [Elusimicrobiota bacterium]